jgi:23S rRNA (cytosine1962-C5)-methyltransferase
MLPAMARSSLPSVSITARGRARLASGHPWIYRQDVAAGPDSDATSGGPALVQVTDERKRPLALATWALASPVALRILDHNPSTEPNFLRIVEERLGRARARRAKLRLDRDAFRLVHGESDGLPGLFVDIYADAAVLQTTSVAMDAHRDQLATMLRTALDVHIVIGRDDGSARDFEGLPRQRAVLAGGGATEVTYRLGQNRLLADLLTDSKTGGFLDQADNHALVASLAPAGARCFDAFTYHGGFALAVARMGGQVLANDEDAVAVARTQANAKRNRLDNLTVRHSDAFDLLRSLEADKQQFEVVVLDPPAFAKRKSGDTAADRAYREIFLRGLRLTAPDGLTVACSCSGRVSREHFDRLVAEAAADCGRGVQIIARMGAGRDHPELVGVPETGHLKCWILRVV